MKYLSIDSPGKAAIYEEPYPERKPGEATIKLLYGGICGSDLGSYRGTYAYVNTRRIIGHEVAAEIVDIGENDRGLKKGSIVTLNPYFNCGHCYSCRRGLVNCCTDNQTLGCQRDGAFREYYTIDVNRLFDGGSIPPEKLVLVEPFVISYHGVKMADIKPGQRVLIVGAGTIGVLAALAAKHFGAKVYLCDVAEDKLQYASESFPVDGVFLNSSPEEFTRKVNEITEGDLFDVTVEAAGFPSTFQNCIDAACYDGHVIVMGISKQSADFSFTTIQKKELIVRGSRNGVDQDFYDVMDIVASNEFDISKLVTNIYPFDEAPRALEEFDKNAASMLKVLLKF